eukprot:TRINITY_DN1844_c0_g2_i1.p1 TRINITY_DN1844_c0_g2~~TRINITY_DN1844_c0_g2_i1.p1  ORF type:complete len:763 (+),score=73.03 TRINITY_DN1844_c0_g2_i1:39-2291(+)
MYRGVIKNFAVMSLVVVMSTAQPMANKMVMEVDDAAECKILWNQAEIIDKYSHLLIKSMEINPDCSVTKPAEVCLDKNGLKLKVLRDAGVSVVVRVGTEKTGSKWTQCLAPVNINILAESIASTLGNWYDGIDILFVPSVNPDETLSEQNQPWSSQALLQTATANLNSLLNLLRQTLPPSSIALTLQDSDLITGQPLFTALPTLSPAVDYFTVKYGTIAYPGRDGFNKTAGSCNASCSTTLPRTCICFEGGTEAHYTSVTNILGVGRTTIGSCVGLAADCKIAENNLLPLLNTFPACYGGFTAMDTVNAWTPIGNFSSVKTGQENCYLKEFAAEPLTDGLGNVTVFTPSRVNGVYRGSRYEWLVIAAITSRTTDKDNLARWPHTLSKPTPSTWNPYGSAPLGFAYEWGCGEASATCSGLTVSDSGTPVTNGVLGWDATPSGQSFLKIGVGKLTKPAGAADYDPAYPYRIETPLVWNVTEQTAEKLVMEAEDSVSPEYSYELTREITYTSKQVTVKTILRNTGTATIRTAVQPQNVLNVDAQKTSKFTTIQVPKFSADGTTVTDDFKPGCTICSDKVMTKGNPGWYSNGLAYTFNTATAMTQGEFKIVADAGFSDQDFMYVRVENPDLSAMRVVKKHTAAVKVKLVKLELLSDINYVSVRPTYATDALAAGETAEWVETSDLTVEFTPVDSKSVSLSALLPTLALFLISVVLIILGQRSDSDVTVEELDHEDQALTSQHRAQQEDEDDHVL